MQDGAAALGRGKVSSPQHCSLRISVSLNAGWPRFAAPAEGRTARTTSPSVHRAARAGARWLLRFVVPRGWAIPGAGALRGGKRGALREDVPGVSGHTEGLKD